ncbi:MAG TPA: hypothetical protein VH280_19035, partial [Verrucomicrobiae bacterium]|nr:hypothetical protein [Verrucomicrobiae bacterium]
PVGTNWIVTTLAGSPESLGEVDGTGSAARFYSTTDITMDHAGNLYVTDKDNQTIRRAFLANGAPVICAFEGLKHENGQFGFNIAAAPGQPVVVDASSDLVDWLPIWTNTTGSGALFFSENYSGNSNRFYRAHLP